MSQKEVVNQPTFSIIIPMKNAEKYISNALDSIAKQEYNDIEVLVIDDNSDLNDNSKTIVESWKKENSLIQIKSYETQEGHRGPGGARNVGLDNAIGKYILFLDSDDELNDNALNSIDNAITNNPDTDMFVLGYQLTRLDLNEKRVNNLKLPARKLQESRLFQVGANTAGAIWNTCMKRELFEGKNGRGNIRFKENCIFEDLPTKVHLFTENKKSIKAVKHLTHTQFSRPCESITGSIKFKDIHRMIEVNKEIANLKPNLDPRDKMYVNIRLASVPALLSWFTVKCIRNKIDRLKQKVSDKEECR